MKVALNTAIESRGTSGSAVGARHLADSIRRQGHELVRLPFPHQLGGNALRNAGLQAHWDLVGAARSAGDADVLISPCNVGHARRGQRGVVLIHDTMVLDRPDLFDRGYAAYSKLLFGLSARLADVVLCPSAYTAERLVERWPRIPTPVVAHWPVPVDAAAGARRPPERPRALVLGATEPHKRQRDAIAAVAYARRVTGLDIGLDVVGPAGRDEPAVVDAIEAADPAGAWARRLIDIPYPELRAMLSSAFVLLQPSVFEGYGLPVAEASAFGTPVVHSGGGALAEISPSGWVDARGRDAAEAYGDAVAALVSEAVWLERSRTAVDEARRLSADAFDAAVATAIGAPARAGVTTP